jgi:putative peptidoglycan lipid II flippase
MSKGGGRHRRHRRPTAAVVRQSGLTSIAASLAILSGLLLDIAIAAVFGAGRATDAFVVAARISLGVTAVVMVVGNQVLVPTVVAWVTEHSAERAQRLVNSVVATALFGGLIVAAIIAALASPIVAIVAPGFPPPQQEVTADILRVMVLFVPLTAASEVLRAWLNAHLSFVFPALMTLVLNVVATAIVLAIRGSIIIVAQAYIAGAVVQLVVMAAAASRRGLRPRKPTTLRDPELRALGRLCVRPTGGAFLNPAARLVEAFVASFLAPGSATILHYGNRMVHAVGGTVLFRSVIIAVVPRMTRAYAENDQASVRQLARLGLRIMLALSLPLTALGAVLAGPATQVFFAVGRFSPDQAALLGAAFTLYAFSFPGSAIQRALLAPFYAARDTRTPLRNTIYGVGANLLLLPILVLLAPSGELAVLGVVLAYTLSQYVNVAHAWRRFRQDVGPPLSPSVLSAALRCAVGSAAGALVAAIVLLAFAPLSEGSRAGELFAVLAAAAAGLIPVALAEYSILRAARRTRLDRGRSAPRTRPPPGGSTVNSSSATSASYLAERANKARGSAVEER